MVRTIQLSLRSYPTYEEWKLCRLWCLWCSQIYSVLILPMRNGNVINSMWYEGSIYCSYPTYEEWKLRSNSPNRPRGSSGSYPTYEEWKHDYVLYGNAMWYVLILPMRNGNYIIISDLNRSLSSSYPTYEEWKLGKILYFVTHICVLILPMRNGNFNVW